MGTLINQISMEGPNHLEFLLERCCFLLGIYLSWKIQIGIHEAGHLLFGWLTGYRFVSFRLGKQTLYVEEGKLRRGYISIPGTVGQCLMDPPNIDGRPYALYHLGGCLANFIVALVCLPVCMMAVSTYYMAIFFYSMSVVGILVALYNGIPMRKRGRPSNDGYYLLRLRGNPRAQRAMGLQLHINALAAKGVRLREMPAKWFVLAPEDDLENPAIAGLAAYDVDYLMDRRLFAEAQNRIETMLGNPLGLNGFQFRQLQCERLFLLLIQKGESEEMDRLFPTELQEYIEKTRALWLSSVRVQYTYRLFAERDPAAIGLWRAEFEQVAAKIPKTAGVQSERELMETAVTAWETHKAVGHAAPQSGAKVKVHE